MASFTSLFTIVLVCVAAVDKVYSCSCMPSHPQDQFCRAHFAIRAKVVGHRWIYELDPPKEPTEHELDPPKEPTEHPTTKQSPTEPPAKTTITPFKSTDSYFDIDNEIPNEIPLERFRKALEPLPSLEDVRKEKEEKREEEIKEPVMQAWRVKVIKVYKGVESLEEKKYVELLTAPYDSLCGVSLLDKSTHYVITGTSFDGVLRIGSCGWHQQYNTLTPRQKQGLKSGYSTGCGDCRIQPCFGECVALPNANICTWMPFTDCETKHSKCIRKRNGSCGWHTNKYLNDCKAIDY